MYRISVIGTGYVGLVHGAGLASAGNRVISVDIDEHKVAMLQNGQIPIFEKGLDELVSNAMQEGNISFTTDLEEAVKRSEIHFLAVPTPSDADGNYIMEHILRAATDMGRILAMKQGRDIVVIKSTILPEGYEPIRNAIIGQLSEGMTVDVVSNPETLAEGTAVENFKKPDRIIIGADSSFAQETLRDLYAPFVKRDGEILMMSPVSAITSKGAANFTLALRLSGINEIARYCDRVGADAEDVRRAVGLDKRIGSQYLYPGPGWGGSCFPKDTRALEFSAEQHGLQLPVLRATQESNKMHKRYLPERIQEYFAQHGGIEGKTFGIWGLAFKAGTDDMRDSPAIDMIRHLHEGGAMVHAFDEKAMVKARDIFPESKGNIKYFNRKYDATNGADALIIMTESDGFKTVDYNQLLQDLQHRVIFDGRNILNPKQVQGHGFDYFGIGRRSLRDRRS